MMARWCLRGLVGVVLVLSLWGCNCGKSAGRACQTDDDCKTFAPAVYCFGGFCNEKQCEPGNSRSCYDADEKTAGVGHCKKGTQTCSANGLWGKCAEQLLPRPEICDRVDNDCDGKADEELDCQCKPGTQRMCYNGPVGTRDKGVCRAGVQYCEDDNKWGRCLEQTLPGPEACDKRDNDCNELVDDNPLCICEPGLTQECYSGALETKDTKPCQTGLQVCGPERYWGAKCNKEIVPVPETCNNLDDDCNGKIDDAIDCGCKPGTTRACESLCKTPGKQFCTAEGKWDPPCRPDETPKAEECGNGKDDDCDGEVDEGCNSGDCKAGETRACYSGDEKVAGVGSCKKGTQTCKDDGSWGTCEGEVKPKTIDLCNGEDDDCDGAVDEDYADKGQSCTVGKGECQATGTLVCKANGSGVECDAQAKQPGTETCDGKDNDCDGEIDENFPTKGQSCTAGAGECLASGKKVCKSDGSDVECDAQAKQPGTETCNDGKDNDCDGAVDEDCACQGSATQPCYLGGCQADSSAPSGYTCKGLCRAGTQSCKADGTWGTCQNAVSPQTELCDGLDNNCDGSVDEDFATKGQSCTVGKGECEVTGKLVCNAAKSGVECDAQPKAGSAEICDGKDNDCDGSVDENFATKGQSCTAGKGICQNSGKLVCSTDGSMVECDARPNNPGTEVCNFIDDDCDGEVDEDFPDKGQSCTVGKGECQNTGTYICKTDKSDVVCDVQPKAGSAEVCDGKDNNCDGTVDEGCTCKENDTQKCYSAGSGCFDDDGQGNYSCSAPCTTGTQTCQNGKWGACQGEVVPKTETCNNIDDNCDGTIDEGLERDCYTGASGTEGKGECFKGTQSCTAGQWETCSGEMTPQTEICDGLDNDCDGQTDEDFPNKGQACNSGMGGVCEPGTLVCNGAAAECEPKIQPGTQQEVCDGKDNDCDGTIDGMTRSCYSGDALTRNKGQCSDGTETCTSGQWGSCQGDITPQTEICDGIDNDCDGQTDEDNVCNIDTGGPPDDGGPPDAGTADEGLTYDDGAPDSGPSDEGVTYDDGAPDSGGPSDEGFSYDYGPPDTGGPPDEEFSYDYGPPDTGGPPDEDGRELHTSDNGKLPSPPDEQPPGAGPKTSRAPKRPTPRRKETMASRFAACFEKRAFYRPL